jgi:hypothetical protein
MVLYIGLWEEVGAALSYQLVNKDRSIRAPWAYEARDLLRIWLARLQGQVVGPQAKMQVQVAE